MTPEQIERLRARCHVAESQDDHEVYVSQADLRALLAEWESLKGHPVHSSCSVCETRLKEAEARAAEWEGEAGERTREYLGVIEELRAEVARLQASREQAVLDANRFQREAVFQGQRADNAEWNEDNARVMLDRISVAVGKLPGEAVDEAATRRVRELEDRASEARMAEAEVARLERDLADIVANDQGKEQEIERLRAEVGRLEGQILVWADSRSNFSAQDSLVVEAERIRGEK